MTKKEEKTEAQEQELKTLETANRPTANVGNKAVDDYTASHLWQAGSPAADTSVSPELPKENIFDKVDTKENLKAKEQAAKDAAAKDEQLYEYETDDCSKFDVSDSRYCQPGSDRHKAYLKKSK